MMEGKQNQGTSTESEKVSNGERRSVEMGGSRHDTAGTDEGNAGFADIQRGSAWDDYGGGSGGMVGSVKEGTASAGAGTQGTPGSAGNAMGAAGSTLGTRKDQEKKDKS